MALAGAFELVADEPGNRAVVIFPDSVFKYASSVVKHLSELSTGPARSTKTKSEQLLDAMIENVRANPDLTIDLKSAHGLWETQAPLVLDVRESDEYRQSHVEGAVNIPLHELAARVPELPADRQAHILTVCERGNISLPAVLLLTSLGYQSVRSVSGGTSAWQEMGYATESG
jgi:rhodanese-related sulfurtransferase